MSSEVTFYVKRCRLCGRAFTFQEVDARTPVAVWQDGTQVFGCVAPCKNTWAVEPERMAMARRFLAGEARAESDNAGESSR